MITSLSNPLVKDLARLRQRRHRERTGLFLIEGRRAVAMALASGTTVVQQVICPELGGAPLSQSAPVAEMAPAPFRKLSVRQNPDGIIAVARHLDTGLERVVIPTNPLILVVDALEKPGNLGAMLRTADAVGATAVVVCDPATDVHNPNVVRASQGSLFTLSLAVATVTEAITWLAERSIRLVAMTPRAPDLLWDCDLTASLALVIGAEAAGLSPELISAADQLARLPMVGKVDSLNASAAAAVVLYEAARQRRQRGLH